LKVYRSSQYRKVLAYLLRAGGPVLTKQVLLVLGVPLRPADAEYARGYGVVSRLIARGWLEARPAQAGHVNLVTLTESGTEVARELEAEVEDIVSIYGTPIHPGSVGGGPKKVQIPAVAPRPEEFDRGEGLAASPPSPHRNTARSSSIECDQCSERVPVQQAGKIYKHCGEVRCSCGNDLTDTYLDMVENSISR
jgi:DNA-binding MarR family transcriptional regulator